MRYCTYCGAQIHEEAVICPTCGCPTKQPIQQEKPQQNNDTLRLVAKILMIYSTVLMGLYIFPLAWCIPMTLSYSDKIKKGEPVSATFKICTLLFVNTIAGILMLLDNE